jgi:PHD/YefM family antitoxin component YafN of YafNO toxin-antitoxin module
MTLNPQYVTDKRGKKVAVQLSVKEYAYLLDELELKEDVKAYDKAMKRKQFFSSFEDAVKRIKSARKK